MELSEPEAAAVPAAVMEAVAGKLEPVDSPTMPVAVTAAVVGTAAPVES